MNLITFIKSFFGAKSTTAKAVAIEVKNRSTPKESRTTIDESKRCPLDIEVNRAINIDRDILEMLKGAIKFKIPKLTEQQVSAIGVIDLGQGTKLYRFYFDDGDTWLQIMASGGVSKDSIEEIAVFSYNNVQNPTSDAELARIAGKGSAIGLPTYNYCDSTYDRMWHSEEGQTELSHYIESVWNEEGGEYDICHSAMLYSRNIENSERNELLLFSVEEFFNDNGEQEVTVTTSVGITLYTNDISVH